MSLVWAKMFHFILLIYLHTVKRESFKGLIKLYPKAYIDYLVYFHGLRDYFECHEVLEEHWKKDDKAERKKYWVGLIQIAVAL